MAENKILIVDDDPALCKVLAMYLEKQGYRVLTSGDSAQGLEKFNKERPGLVIADWTMPGMDGVELCRQIKKIDSTAYFIFLSGRGAIHDRVAGLDAGADDFLSKPADTKELLARIRAGFRLYEVSIELQAVNCHLENTLAQVQTQQGLMARDLKSAAEFLQSLLPEPFSSTGIKAHWRFLPSAVLGGDYFDYFWLDDHRLALYILDVTGHGIGSALLAASTGYLLRAEPSAAGDRSKPETVLTSLNHNLVASESDLFYTMWYGVWDLEGGTLTYACAGHPSPILFCKEGLVPLEGGSLPIGVTVNAEYTAYQVSLQPGNRLYLFSDGIYEIFGANKQLLAEKDFLDWLAEASTLPFEQSLDEIIACAWAFQGRTHFPDDVCLVALELSL
jgi:phosphoserine phosphatase RsbU/P